MESDRGTVRGLGLLPVTTIMAGDKVLRRVTGSVVETGQKIQGYEIHMGRTEPDRGREPSGLKPFLRLRLPGTKESWTDGWVTADGRVLGTYMHGLFDSPGWRRAFLNEIRREKGLPQRRTAASGRGARFHQYDRLADHFEKHVDVDRILEVMGL